MKNQKESIQHIATILGASIFGQTTHTIGKHPICNLVEPPWVPGTVMSAVSSWKCPRTMICLWTLSLVTSALIKRRQCHQWWNPNRLKGNANWEMLIIWWNPIPRQWNPLVLSLVEGKCHRTSLGSKPCFQPSIFSAMEWNHTWQRMHHHPTPTMKYSREDP